MGKKEESIIVLPMKGIGEEREADVTLFRRSISLFGGRGMVLQALLEASLDHPGQNGCQLVPDILGFLNGNRSSSRTLIPLFLFAHIPLRGCADPSIFISALARAVTINLSRWKIFFPLRDLAVRSDLPACGVRPRGHQR